MISGRKKILNACLGNKDQINHYGIFPSGGSDVCHFQLVTFLWLESHIKKLNRVSKIVSFWTLVYLMLFTIILFCRCRCFSVTLSKNLVNFKQIYWNFQNIIMYVNGEPQGLLCLERRPKNLAHLKCCS